MCIGQSPSSYDLYLATVYGPGSSKIKGQVIHMVRNFSVLHFSCWIIWFFGVDGGLNDGTKISSRGCRYAF
jgi:hypothetical protein